MFGFRKAKKADVLSHWYTLVDHFNISCQDFYTAIEKELARRKVPDLKISRVIFSEGGLLSANRLYLRMQRERLVFDICAAPFGVSYFFSMRFAELPDRLPWWQLLLGLVGIVLIPLIFMKLMGFIIGSILAVIFILGSLGVISTYHRETYYRQDTRLMYLEIVNAVVKQMIVEFTSASGVHLLNIRQHSPLMEDLYRTTYIDTQPIGRPAKLPPEPVKT